MKDNRTIYALPSANEEMARKHLPHWLTQGYRVIMGQDRIRFDIPGCEVVDLGPRYLGYAASVAVMIAKAQLANHAVVVFGGDDMDPDPYKTAEQITAEYLAAFPALDGIMQPTGDTMDGTKRICGSPWVGVHWLRHANLGAGPFHPGYFHCYSDEELFDVSSACGRLLQRDDLTQRHDHWTRRGLTSQQHALIHDPIQDHWHEDKALYLRRRASKYPGAVPTGMTPDWKKLPNSMSAPRPDYAL